jgi:hypothetical protein
MRKSISTSKARAGHLVIASGVAAIFSAACTNYKIAVADGGAGGSAGGSAGIGGGRGAGGMAAGGATGSGGASAGAGGGGMGGSAIGSGGAAGTGGPDAAASSDGGADRVTTRALGEACTTGGDCASTHCVGSICCDQACAGPCAQCGSNGRCQMPDDDPACGTIACPTDTPCRDWATSITTTRCKAIGQCKAAADCGYVNAPAKTYCGLYQGMAGAALVCDGSGACGSPTVTCGADGECPVNPGVCCYGGGTKCLGAGGACDPTASSLYSTASCDEAADCPPLYLCCFTAHPGTPGLAYCAPSPCPTETMYLWGQVCNPAVTGECTSGTCKPTAIGPPYALCQ